MRSTILALAALTVAGAAGAQPPRSLHDIPWYAAHPAARAATLRLCRSDSRFSHDTDCINATHADDWDWESRLARENDPGAYLRDPHYWAANRLQRIGALAACSAPRSMYPPATCQAVRQGATLDTGYRQ